MGLEMQPLNFDLSLAHPIRTLIIVKMLALILGVVDLVTGPMAGVSKGHITFWNSGVAYRMKPAREAHMGSHSLAFLSPQGHFRIWNVDRGGAIGRCARCYLRFYASDGPKEEKERHVQKR